MGKIEKVRVKELDKKEEVNNIDVYPRIKNFRKKRFLLEEFLSYDANNQFEKVKALLEDIYDGTLKIDKNLVFKCIAITVDDGDDTAYLPCDLKIFRDKKYLTFSKDNTSKVPFFILFFIGAFLFLSIAASYTAINFINMKKLNVDIDGDGIADINIDLDGDKKPDLNIDIDGDKKPDLNINYKGNKKNVFNIDTKGELSASANLINVDINKDGICDVNCDLNNDGWPDINIDIDGDLIPDFDIDLDNDNIPDLNLDMDGDMQCDLMCDTNGDKKCDKFCIKPDVMPPSSGSSTETGNPGTDSTTVSLVIKFNDGNLLMSGKLYPTDQANVDILTPVKTFTIENTTDFSQVYSVKWIILKNDFITNNFKYKVDATNGGMSKGYTTAPKTEEVILSKVTIAPRVTQKYSITMKLEGTNKPQNEDQGRTFIAKLHVFTGEV
ncbi:MAG: hypothetical protein RR228_01415 [Bacilli bacterium]